MPDGDKVHEGLALKYQKPYMQICDGQFGNKVLADELVLAIWKDARKDGDKLIPLFQKVAERCSRIQNNRLFEEIDWQYEIDHIAELSRSIFVNRRVRTLAEDTCKEQVRELRIGIPSSNCFVGILAKYMWNICKANFWGCISLTPLQYRGISLEYVYERLEEMRPSIDLRILQYAEQIYRHNTFCIPRQPPRHSDTRGDITINTDVFSIGV